MPAEQLIALEGAIADLGALYVAARNFTALRRRAETELLPELNALSGRLRSLLRASRLSDDELDDAAREIVTVGSRWHAALEDLHTSALYQDAVAAYAADEQARLAELVPRLFAGIALEPRPIRFCVAFSASRRARLPGKSPFLDPSSCATALAEAMRAGITPASDGREWWERELPSIDGSDDPLTLESPLWLQIDAGELKCALFRVEQTGALRVFTARLRAAMRIGVGTEATDEWWQAYDESFAAFRSSLLDELDRRGLPRVG